MTLPTQREDSPQTVLTIPGSRAGRVRVRCCLCAWSLDAPNMYIARRDSDQHHTINHPHKQTRKSTP